MPEVSRAFLDDRVSTRYPVLSWFSSHFRERRMQEFIKRLQVRPGHTILDVGGEPYYWDAFPIRCRIVCLNVQPLESKNPNVTVEIYPGGRFPYEDRSFDVVHSNSVIEHVGDFNAQRQFAAEIRRVGARYWVQVPYLFFPYEPHAHLPLFQFLPANMKMWVLKSWRRAGYGLEDMLSIRLLSQAEVRYLFPDGQVYRERFLGMTKSLCAYR